MTKDKIILITGAAGNLGGLLAEHLKTRNLHLLIHKKEVAATLKNQRISISYRKLIFFRQQQHSSTTPQRKESTM